MSTFDGLVTEFPDIRVDFFRPSASHPPPLACFLSHVHSDHLAGLETLKSPFVYCSAATREILLRLERYPCRINYAKGILEARVQTFKNLRFLLKPIPLDTPTEIELAPGRFIQVTLLDANHCPGSVMFLFEGDGKAVLYTGDVRCEPWFVNAIARSPAMIEYSSHLKFLDKIYLDTSIVQDFDLQSKADGIAELLRKVSLYPPTTVFHIQAWTYGYEDVWIALSKSLQSKIHVDDYKMKVFESLRPRRSAIGETGHPLLHLCPEAPALVGYRCGNREHPGCLTTDTNVRLHSCERGAYCSVIETGPVVWIRPIVAHLPSGDDQEEVGIGGGGDDLERDAELEIQSGTDFDELLKAINDGEDFQDLLDLLQDRLMQTLVNRRNVSLDINVSSLGEDGVVNIRQALESMTSSSRTKSSRPQPEQDADGLPSSITFPYSRHSSLPELRHLVQTLAPCDVWPCTFDHDGWARRGYTIESLFGDYCSGNIFSHDLKVRQSDKDMKQQPEQSSSQDHETQASSETGPDQVLGTHSSPLRENGCMRSQSLSIYSRKGGIQPVTNHQNEQAHISQSFIPGSMEVVDLTMEPYPPAQLDSQQCLPDTQTVESRTNGGSNAPPSILDTNQPSFNGDCRLRETTPKIPSSPADNELLRHDAYQAMLRNMSGGHWTDIELISTSNHHKKLDEELII